jgi:hypothetical protein
MPIDKGALSSLHKIRYYLNFLLAHSGFRASNQICLQLLQDSLVYTTNKIENTCSLSQMGTLGM